MKDRKNDDLYLLELVDHLRCQDSPEKMRQALEDLLTPGELQEIAKRRQIFILLAAGVPQRQIAERLGVGIATVTRGSLALQKRKG